MRGLQHRQKLQIEWHPLVPQDRRLQQVKLAANRAKVVHVAAGVVVVVAAEVARIHSRNRRVLARSASQWKARSKAQQILMDHPSRHLK